MNEMMKPDKKAALGIDFQLPVHVGIIMDGNGRWAKQRGKPRVFGHREGMDRVRSIVRLTSDIGVDALSLYAFSTENWSRPKAEVDALMSILVEFFKKDIRELHQNGVKIRHLGTLDAFHVNIRTLISDAVDMTRNNKGLSLNIALNYGSRVEILTALREIAFDISNGILSPDDVNEALLASKLNTCGLPDPDLIIRTSGEKRLSNFLMYQAAYAELAFVEEAWPDFSDELYVQTLRDYAKRDRRFGGVK